MLIEQSIELPPMTRRVSLLRRCLVHDCLKLPVANPPTPLPR
jgi:hypothetical protein